MRFINTKTLIFTEGAVEKYQNQYAILSHTWKDEEELTYQDFLNLDKAQLLRSIDAQTLGLGLEKILKSCAIARSKDIQYLWVDTCCIDKRDKAELDESLNSMFNWYKQAKVCYAFLSDVERSAKDREFAFEHSRWFTRGWTLQELLAPTHLVFLDRSWNEIGTKETFKGQISSATYIKENHLFGNFQSACIATKMSWAAKRETRRPEDIAYCLLGIFGVNMPIQYGEGQNAFIRLQKVLLTETPDESIFSWTKEGIKSHGLLASSPDYFESSRAVTIKPKRCKPRPPYRLTNQGLEWPFPNFFLDVQHGADWNNLVAMSRKHITITLNSWQTEQSKENHGLMKHLGLEKYKNTITIHLRKSKNGQWQRVDCDKEYHSMHVESSGNPLTGTNIKYIYITL
ncbi:MAG: hypothetical protein Q9214_001032 [Letrouitia sp. 1 TL-2023]